MSLPNFIVIGGTKSGTTALYWYLAGHPSVYVGPRHHIGYFAYGVDDSGALLYGDPDLHKWPVTTLDQYESLFVDAGAAKAIGDVSPIYLETPQAAGRIHDLLPEARIICSLRNPVDRAYSDYLMYLRKRGRRIDPLSDLSTSADWAQPDSHFMMLGRYHEQLARYFDLFPSERIHVLLSENLKADSKHELAGIYEFLEVDPEFLPDLETPHNVGGVPSNMVLERILTNHKLREFAKPLVPEWAANRLRRLRTSNMDRPPSLPDEVKSELTEHLAVEIEKTSELTGIDLSHWIS